MDFTITLLREPPGQLLIRINSSSDEQIVLSSIPVRALSLADFVKVIHALSGSSREEFDR